MLLNIVLILESVHVNILIYVLNTVIVEWNIFKLRSNNRNWTCEYLYKILSKLISVHVNIFKFLSVGVKK